MLPLLIAARVFLSVVPCERTFEERNDALENVVLLLAQGTGGCDAFSIYYVEDAADLMRIQPFDEWAVALSDEGTPAYDRDHAAALAALGVPAFACTPDHFPEIMAAALERRPLPIPDSPGPPEAPAGG